MKQAKVIELAKNAGFGNYAFEAAGIFQAFAQLVEQETLEKAAAIAKAEYDMRNECYIDHERDVQVRALSGIQAAANIYSVISRLKDAP